MKLYHVLTVAMIALGACAGAASADQNLDAGPASVETRNYDYGDCTGAQGQSGRTLTAALAVDDNNEIGARVHNYCSAWTYSWGGDYREAYQQLGVVVYRSGFGSWGPFVGFEWQTHQQSSPGGEYESCNSWVQASGTSFQLGCPTLDGSPVPLLPTLP